MLQFEQNWLSFELLPFARFQVMECENGDHAGYLLSAGWFFWSVQIFSE